MFRGARVVRLNMQSFACSLFIFSPLAVAISLSIRLIHPLHFLFIRTKFYILVYFFVFSFSHFCLSFQSINLLCLNQKPNAVTQTHKTQDTPHTRPKSSKPCTCCDTPFKEHENHFPMEILSLCH